MVTAESIAPLTELRSLTAQSENEVERLGVELRELEILVRQANGEIERAQVRQSEANSRLRQIDANSDSYSRQDLREAYLAERDAQIKVNAMRSQLEMFQAKQRYVDRYIAQLRKLSDITARGAQHLELSQNDAPSHGRYISDHQAVIDTIEAQESERQRLAQQMHDGPAQSLTNFILQAEIVERLFDRDPAAARTEISNLKESAKVTFQRVREFIFSLRPMMLDDLGLVPTLRRYVQTFQNKHGVTVNLMITGERDLPPYVNVTFLRALQELLDNAVKHGQAHCIEASAELEPDPICLTVQDDGIGFDAAQVMPSVRERRGSGLVTLEKRADMLGGKVLYQSGSGRGTRVRVEIPTS